MDPAIRNTIILQTERLKDVFWILEKLRPELLEAGDDYNVYSILLEANNAIDIAITTLTEVNSLPPPPRGAPGRANQNQHP